MNRLEKLIQNLCPNGVKYIEINDLINSKIIKIISPSIKIKKNDFFSQGCIPIISQEQEYISGYTNVSDEKIVKDEYVCFGDHSEHIKYVDFKFVQGADGLKIISVVQKSIVNPKYLYYSTCNYYIRYNNYERHFKYFRQMKIPIPPLPVQEEIVRILDNFTKLTAELTTELTTELTARRKQYEYYRNILLNCDKSTPVYELSDIAQYSKSRIDAKEVDENSYIGVDNLLQNKKGKTTSLYIPSEGRLIKYNPGDILIGNIRPYLRKIWFSDIEGGTNGDVLTIQVSSEKVLPRYLFFQLSSESFFSYDIKYSKGAKMPRGNKEAIMRYKISVPPLEEQQCIVDILDRFDKLCNDISEGLPAEIEARQKQYEYYRDKLLTFKPLEEVK